MRSQLGVVRVLEDAVYETLYLGLEEDDANPATGQLRRHGCVFFERVAV